MICRIAKYGARLSLIAENQMVTLIRHLATLKGLDPTGYPGKLGHEPPVMRTR
jgi:hypothetical protein